MTVSDQDELDQLFDVLMYLDEQLDALRAALPYAGQIVTSEAFDPWHWVKFRHDFGHGCVSNGQVEVERRSSLELQINWIVESYEHHRTKIRRLERKMGLRTAV